MCDFIERRVWTANFPRVYVQRCTKEWVTTVESGHRYCAEHLDAFSRWQRSDRDEMPMIEDVFLPMAPPLEPGLVDA